MNNQQQTNQEQNNPSTKNQNFRNTNAGDFITNGQPYQVFPEGMPVSKTKLVRGIKMENRQKVLYSIGLNTLALNPHLTEDEIFNSLFSINNNPKQINAPLKYSDLKKITASIFKKREEEGELAPDINHTRYIIFDNINFPMTKKEKRAIVGKEVGIMKTTKTKQAIYETIESWNKPEKITIKKLTEILGKGFSERTIKSYWPEFKAYVKSINETIKINKPIFIETSTHEHEQSPDLNPVQETALIKVYDTPEDFHNLVRQHSSTISSDRITYYYKDMKENGIQRSEANIKSVFML